MSYHPKPHRRGVDGVAVHVVGTPRPQSLPGYWSESVRCGGAGRCARRALGEIPYIPADAVGETRPDVVMLPILEAERLPDGSWALGPGYWAEAAGRGPRIPLPAVVRCPWCRTGRRVGAAPVHHSPSAALE